MSRPSRLPHTVLSPLVLIGVLLAGGCGEEPDEDRLQQIEQRLGAAQQAAKQAQQQTERVQNDLDRAVLETRRWQTITAWVSAGTVLMLVAGTALGSAARRYAHEQPRHTDPSPAPNADPHDGSRENGTA